MEQDDCSSCSSLPPLESSNDTEIITIEEESVPGLEHTDELYMFLMDHREWICSLIQTDWPGWDDCLFSAPRRVSEHSRLGQDDGGAPEPDHHL